MKTLVLIRHAKSSWDHADLADEDRPLNKRGLKDAPVMGRRLADRGLAPDVVLSSTAVRARTTAEIIAGELGFDPARIVADDRLYGATPDEVLEVIGELDDALSCAIVVGHNPETASIAHRFSKKIQEMPTAAVAEFTFDVSAWSELADAEPITVRVDTPRS